MVDRDTLEGFLLRMGVEFEELEAGMWMLPLPEGDRMALMYSPPALLLRARVGEVPGDAGEAAHLFRRLLEANTAELVRGAFGLDGDEVVLTDSLDLASLDYDALQEAIDAMQVALVQRPDALRNAAASPEPPTGEGETDR